MRILCVGTGARADYLVSALKESNHSVATFDSVLDAAYLVAIERIDGVIALTRGDALQAARSLVARPAHTVLVVIDNPGDHDTRVAALYAGADACLAAQYEYAELEARLHALWRDAARSDADGQRELASSRPGVLLSRATRSLIGGRPVALSRREYLLMERLLRSAGTVVHRDELISYVFDDADTDNVSLQRLVAALRRRIAESGCNFRLDNVPRVGYRVEADG